MIRLKCPKCAGSLGIPETQSGTVASCPKCGQKFRVPTTAAKPSAPGRAEAARQPKAASTDDEPVRQTAHDDREDRYEEEPERDEAAPRPKKRKPKKKRQKPESGGPNAAHLTLVVVGVFVVAAATGLVFFVPGGALSNAQ